MNPKFSLGKIVITANANDTLSETDKVTALDRHVVGDWGDLCDEDKKENEAALATGQSRLHSQYTSESGKPFWVITEWDRSTTTLLMPEDY